VSRSTVEVSRGLLVALAATAAAGIVAVTFLVGRESGRAAQPASATSPTTITIAGAEEAPPGAIATPNADASAPTAAPAAAPVAPAIEGSLAFPQLAVPAGVASPGVAPASHDTLRNEVASYFREVETIQSRGKSWGDPQALAQTLLAQAAKGDVSGFDGLAAANRGVRDALLAVAAPEPCREHHRLTLALLDESIAMLDRVKGLISGADAGSLAAMPAEGQALERKAKDVDAMAAEIKRRFGI
jgi:hypothetical protein